MKNFKNLISKVILTAGAIVFIFPSTFLHAGESAPVNQPPVPRQDAAPVKQPDQTTVQAPKPPIVSSQNSDIPKQFTENAGALFPPVPEKKSEDVQPVAFRAPRPFEKPVVGYTFGKSEPVRKSGSSLLMRGTVVLKLDKDQKVIIPRGASEQATADPGTFHKYWNVDGPAKIAVLVSFENGKMTDISFVLRKPGETGTNLGTLEVAPDGKVIFGSALASPAGPF